MFDIVCLSDADLDWESQSQPVFYVGLGARQRAQKVHAKPMYPHDPSIVRDVVAACDENHPLARSPSALYIFDRDFVDGFNGYAMPDAIYKRPDGSDWSFTAECDGKRWHQWSVEIIANDWRCLNGIEPDHWQHDVPHPSTVPAIIEWWERARELSAVGHAEDDHEAVAKRRAEAETNRPESRVPAPSTAWNPPSPSCSSSHTSTYRPTSRPCRSRSASWRISSSRRCRATRSGPSPFVSCSSRRTRPSAHRSRSDGRSHCVVSARVAARRRTDRGLRHAAVVARQRARVDDRRGHRQSCAVRGRTGTRPGTGREDAGRTRTGPRTVGARRLPGARQTASRGAVEACRTTGT